jgi:hypothetical protein
MFKLARDSEKPCNDFCEVGMFKTMVPIVNNSEFIGGLSACGVSIIGDPLEEFLIAKALDLDETAATELAESAPKAPMSYLGSISRLFLMALEE